MDVHRRDLELMRAVLQDVVVVVGREDGDRLVVCRGRCSAVRGCSRCDVHFVGRCIAIDDRDIAVRKARDILIDCLIIVTHDIGVLVDYSLCFGVRSRSSRLIDTRQQGLRFCRVENRYTIPIGQAVDIDIVLIDLRILPRSCRTCAGRIGRSVHRVAVGAVARDGDRRRLGQDGEGAVVNRQPACRRLDAGIF